ncbi:MAG: GDYXXLXY domain-containing protein, partial [Candidatus Thiodiazotropha sp.]
QIFFKEQIVSDGDRLLLQLAPRDPRALLQGDYMALRYAMADEVAQAAAAAGMDDGRIVVEVQPTGEARFVDLYRGQAPASGQRLLHFRKRGDSVRLASDAYFFQEGQSEVYADARYGELHVDTDGDAVLTGLFDGEFKRLGTLFH